MNYFEGQYKSKPNIKLSGSSISVNFKKSHWKELKLNFLIKKTKEELIREAFLERKKREVI